MKTAESIKWVSAGPVNNFRSNEGACALLKGNQVAIFQVGDSEKWFACQNQCPHKGDFVLSRGIIGDAKGEPKVACPQHKKTFSLISGNNLGGEDYSIKTYPVKVEGGDLFVGMGA